MTALNYYQWESVSLLSALENNLVASDCASPPFACLHTTFESRTSHLICSVPLQGSNDGSYSFFPSTVEHWHLILWVFSALTLDVSSPPPPFYILLDAEENLSEGVKKSDSKNAFFFSCLEMIRLIILYYRLQGIDEEVTGSIYSSTACICVTIYLST